MGVYGLLLAGVGASLAIGGVRLIYLGGSAYYVAAGVLAAASGIAVICGRWRAGASIYLLLMTATLAWALWEAGLNGWALAPRVLSPAVLGLPLLIVALVSGGRWARLGAGLSLAAGLGLISAVAWASRYVPVSPPQPSAPVAAASDSEWSTFGARLGGGWFSPLTQINSGNVGQLKTVWTTLLGPLPARPIGLTQTVPVKVGDSLYVCTPFGDMAELDPKTGKVRWRYDAHADSTGIPNSKCRGVAYYAVPGATGLCATRVFTATNNARLIGVDARTGKPCPGFGESGIVNLWTGLKTRGPGYYGVTSVPLIVRGKIVVGGQVADGQHVGEPSGVIRAFDAVTGKLAWAWDLGNPTNRGEPKPGQYYTSGTPNAWAPMSADDALGLIYVPMGNATPDRWGGHRSAQSNRYASSVVALEIETGAPRWSFQTTHYDVWDYDVASQPVLYDLPSASGVIPVVIQPTKAGQVFVLDRRTGKPVFPVEERPAPQAGAVERLSPTQPWSPAMPDLGGPRLQERTMWGLTALDQLWCRIKFREARYEGPMTPPGLTPSIQYPGSAGGVNWASASIDPVRRLAFIASNRMATRVRLITRAEADGKGLKPTSAGDRGGPVAQEGAPYAVDVGMFLSPLSVPCQAPPNGMLNAVDLATGRMVWSRPLGEARDLGPFGWRSHLPVTLGTPLLGGPMSTAGGVVFVGASQDHAFRAFDSGTGRLLFTADLPGSSPTTAMTYLDRDGRQVVAIASSARRGQTRYSAITAFALR